MGMLVKIFQLFAALAAYFVLMNTVLAADRTSSVLLLDDSTIVVANSHSHTISFVDLHDQVNGKIEIEVGKSPQTLAYDSALDRLWVTNQAENTVTIISVSDKSVDGQIETAQSPFGVVFDDSAAYITNQESNLIQVFDLNNFTLIASIPVSNSPRGMSLSKNKNTLFVTHFSSGEISVIDTAELSLIKTISLGSRAGLTQAIVIDEGEAVAYVPNTMRNSDNKNLVFDNTVFPFVSIIDLDELIHLREERIALDIIDKPVGMPLEAALQSSILYVANAASNDLTIIDLKSKKALAHVEVGSFPNGIVISKSGEKIYIHNSLDGTISIVDTESLIVSLVIESTVISESSAVLNGQKLFHSSDDTRMAKDQWIACATCHFGGGADNVNWFFPDGLRNTPSLIGATDTGPFHWSGNLDEIQDVEDTIRKLQGGTGLVFGSSNCLPSCDTAEKNAGRSSDLDDITAYLSSLKFSTAYQKSNYKNEIESISRGRELFFDKNVGCSDCHKPPFYMDNKNHMMPQGNLTSNSLNTPSLTRLSISSPYLHDGSARILSEVLTSAPSNSAHGVQEFLTLQQLVDLIAFTEAIEPPTQMVVEREYSELTVPQKFDSLTARAKVDFEINLEYDNDDIILKIGYRHGANVDTDTYLVVEDNISGKYWLLDEFLNLNDINTSNYTPTSSAGGASYYQLYSFPEVRVANLDVAGQIFTFYTITLEKGDSPYTIENWLSYEIDELKF
jgi:YVTN family beta-propeller protein